VTTDRYGPGSVRSLIVIPTYNERDNVEDIARRFLVALPTTDLLFVDDNSPDGTGALLDDMAKVEPRIHVMHRAGKLGLGTAYVEGFGWGLARNYDYLFEMDADGSHDPKYLPQMLALGHRPQDHLARGRHLRAHDPRGRHPGSHRRIHVLATRHARGDRPADDHVERLQLPDRDEVPRAPPRVPPRRNSDHVRRPAVGQSKLSRAIVIEALAKVWKLRFGGR
jgi:glycosyltransferase involved in cell wall biosynthesis